MDAKTSRVNSLNFDFNMFCVMYDIEVHLDPFWNVLILWFVFHQIWEPTDVWAEDQTKQNNQRLRRKEIMSDVNI